MYVIIQTVPILNNSKVVNFAINHAKFFKFKIKKA